MLGLQETVDGLAKENGIRGYRHVLRRKDDSVLKIAADLKVIAKRKRERPKKTRKKQVKKEIGLRQKMP